MRIGYLLTLFPKLSESFVLNEVVELQARGLDITPICLDRSRKLEPKRHAAADRLRGPVHYVGDGFPRAHAGAIVYWLLRRPVRTARLFVRNLRHPAPRGESKLGRLLLALRAGRIAREARLEHLHAHWSYPGDVGLLLRDFLGMTFSFTAHAHDIFEDIELYEAKGLSFRDRVAKAEFVVACTAYNVRCLEQLCPPQLHPRLHYAYHGLDLQVFAPRSEATSQDSTTLLSVGRFVPYKGFDVVVRACARLRDRGHDVRCLLVGPDGSQTPVVARLIEELDLTANVRMLGPRTQEELLRLYHQANIYVNASNPEGEYGVANVIVEALAAGLPTIATSRPQVTEYIEDGKNGLLFPYGDDDALAQAIERVIRDPELAKALGSEARRAALELFDIKKTTDLLSSLFGTAGGPALSEAPPASSTATATL